MGDGTYGTLKDISYKIFNKCGCQPSVMEHKGQSKPLVVLYALALNEVADNWVCDLSA